MNLREMFKQVAREVINKLSNIALAVKLHLGATPEAARPAMAAALASNLARAPSFGLGGGGGSASSRPNARRRTHKDTES